MTDAMERLKCTAGMTTPVDCPTNDNGEELRCEDCTVKSFHIVESDIDALLAVMLAISLIDEHETDNAPMYYSSDMAHAWACGADFAVEQVKGLLDALTDHLKARIGKGR